MNTAKKIYRADEQGVVHVDLPTGQPGQQIEVLVVWDRAESAEGNEDWSDLFGLTREAPLAREPQGVAQQREPLK